MTLDPLTPPVDGTNRPPLSSPKYHCPYFRAGSSSRQGSGKRTSNRGRRWPRCQVICTALLAVPPGKECGPACALASHLRGAKPGTWLEVPVARLGKAGRRIMMRARPRAGEVSLTHFYLLPGLVYLALGAAFRLSTWLTRRSSLALVPLCSSSRVEPCEPLVDRLPLFLICPFPPHCCSDAMFLDTYTIFDCLVCETLAV